MITLGVQGGSSGFPEATVGLLLPHTSAAAAAAAAAANNNKKKDHSHCFHAPGTVFDTQRIRLLLLSLAPRVSITLPRSAPWSHALQARSAAGRTRDGSFHVFICGLLLLLCVFVCVLNLSSFFEPGADIYRDLY